MSILDNFDVVGVPRTFSIAEVRILKNRISFKRGSACYKTRVRETVSILNKTETVEVFRNRWVIDREPPIFSQEREYVEKWI